MVFEVQGMTDSFVRLERDNSGIEFLGKSFYRTGTKVKAQVYPRGGTSLGSGSKARA